MLGLKHGAVTYAERLAIYAFHVKKLSRNNHTVDDGVNIPTDDVNIPTNDDVFKLINFNVKLADRRTMISLEAYLVDALKHKLGLQTNAEVRMWIESLNIDALKPIARQIKYQIVLGHWPRIIFHG